MWKDKTKAGRTGLWMILKERQDGKHLGKPQVLFAVSLMPEVKAEMRRYAV